MFFNGPHAPLGHLLVTFWWGEIQFDSMFGPNLVGRGDHGGFLIPRDDLGGGSEPFPDAQSLASRCHDLRCTLIPELDYDAEVYHSAGQEVGRLLGILLAQWAGEGSGLSCNASRPFGLGAILAGTVDDHGVADVGRCVGDICKRSVLEGCYDAIVVGVAEARRMMCSIEGCSGPLILREHNLRTVDVGGVAICAVRQGEVILELGNWH